MEAIPPNPRDWHVQVASPQASSDTLKAQRDLVFLFRDLATLRRDLPLFASVDDLLWKGPTPAFASFANRLDQARFQKGKHRGTLPRK